MLFNLTEGKRFSWNECAMCTYFLSYIDRTEYKKWITAPKMNEDKLKFCAKDFLYILNGNIQYCAG